MFLSEPSSEMNLQTTSRGVCVRGGIGRRRGGAGTGRTKRVDDYKGLSLDLEPVPGPFPFLVSFPFLSFASLRQRSEREINNLCTLSAAWGVAISSQGKLATLPALAQPTAPRRKCFLGGDSVWTGPWLTLWVREQAACTRGLGNISSRACSFLTTLASMIHFARNKCPLSSGYNSITTSFFLTGFCLCPHRAPDLDLKVFSCLAFSSLDSQVPPQL